jgi:hypothetical protein
MKKTPKRVRPLPLEKRAELAFREAVEDVISEHARLGLPLYIGQGAKVIKLSPNKVRVLARATHRKRPS